MQFFPAYLEYYLNSAIVNGITNCGLICAAAFQLVCILACIILPGAPEEIEYEDSDSDIRESSSESSSPCASAFSCINTLVKVKKVEKKKRK